jgi:hypothetical protein
VQDYPWHAIPIRRVFNDFFFPITLSLAALISIPFMISKYAYFLSSLYIIGGGSSGGSSYHKQLLIEIRYFLEHFCYSSAFFVYSLYWWGHHARQSIIHLLRSVRDDEYLIGRQLRNLERDESSPIVVHGS